MKEIALPLILLFSLALSENPIELEDDPNYDKVEFIANYEQEPYLGFIEELDKNYLDLFNLKKTLLNTDFSQDPTIDLYCPHSFFDSFGVSSYFIPVQKPDSITDCPNMKQTCCYQRSMNDLNQLWENKYKPYLDYNYEYFRYYLVQIMSKHSLIQKTANKVLKSDRNVKCKEVAKKLVDTVFGAEDLKILKRAINNLKQFEIKLKKNFMCFLCDYESLRHIQMEEKIVSLDYKICEQIVKGTYQEYYYLNDFVYKYLNTANFLTYCVNNENLLDFGNLNLLKGAKIEFLEIDNSLTNQQCKYALDGGYNLIANCFRYCQNYNFWYYGQPIFRSIHSLSAIFENINEKIFKNQLGFKISKPQPLHNKLPIFDVQNNSYNIFDFYHYIFKERAGIDRSVIFD